jgi:hypothetical protein
MAAVNVMLGAALPDSWTVLQPAPMTTPGVTCANAETRVSVNAQTGDPGPILSLPTSAWSWMKGSSASPDTHPVAQGAGERNLWVIFEDLSSLPELQRPCRARGEFRARSRACRVKIAKTCGS